MPTAIVGNSCLVIDPSPRQAGLVDGLLLKYEQWI